MGDNMNLCKRCNPEDIVHVGVVRSWCNCSLESRSIDIQSSDHCNRVFHSHSLKFHKTCPGILQSEIQWSAGWCKGFPYLSVNTTSWTPTFFIVPPSTSNLNSSWTNKNGASTCTSTPGEAWSHGPSVLYQLRFWIDTTDSFHQLIGQSDDTYWRNGFLQISLHILDSH